MTLAQHGYDPEVAKVLKAIVNNFASPGGVPCETCNRDFSLMTRTPGLTIDPVLFQGSNALLTLVASWRNEVNKKLGKPIYPVHLVISKYNTPESLDPQRLFTSGVAWEFLFISALMAADPRKKQIFRNNLANIIRFASLFPSTVGIANMISFSPDKYFGQTANGIRGIPFSDWKPEDILHAVWLMMGDVMETQYSWEKVKYLFMEKMGKGHCTQTCKAK